MDSKTTFTYFDLGNGRMTVMIEKIDRNSANVSFSFCSPRDMKNFTRAAGRCIALERMKDGKCYRYTCPSDDTLFDKKRQIVTCILWELVLDDRNPMFPSWAKKAAPYHATNYINPCRFTPVCSLNSR